MQHARTHAEHHTRRYAIHIEYTRIHIYLGASIYIYDYFMIILVLYIYIYKSPKIP